MVITLEAHVANKPIGRPVGVPMPEAPVVAWVIAVKGVLIHTIGLDDAAPAVIFGVTMIVPVAFTVPQPPVKGMV